ncbi:MAG: RHS repeat-associated core domain-containing protein [Bacteroidales bacterium]|nr:RHS repeat-associated core domain-containing protein [Bacteroidales bacterium]MCM1416957.1 RHS repeat-associated core domain-containing protein [bacterium]
MLYDLNGNRLLKEQYRNESVDVTEGYRYNERNELTERVRAGSLTRYRYDRNGSIISEEEEGRRSEYRYDLLNRQIYVKTPDGREQENLYDGEGLRAGLVENGKKTTFLYHNGEIFTECDGESAPVRRYVSGLGLSHVQTADGAYHAYHQDEQGSTAYITGQYYLKERYYNPVVGRFLQEDTYRGDGLNLYAYCANNPVLYYDPSGQTCEKQRQKST